MGQTMETPGPVVEVEFTIQDAAYPFVAASEREECTFELAEMIPRPDGRYAEFFTVTGTDPARIAALAEDFDAVDVTLLTVYDDGGSFEFLVSEGCPALRLAELGALPRTVEGVNGTGRIVAEIPAQYESSTVVETFLEETPDAELRTKREKSSASPLFTRSGLEYVLEAHLTERQREVVRTAFEAGYYEWPRKCTGADVAASLDISSATFSEHIHAAERNLLTAMLGRPRSDAD